VFVPPLPRAPPTTGARTRGTIADRAYSQQRERRRAERCPRAYGLRSVTSVTFRNVAIGPSPPQRCSALKLASHGRARLYDWHAIRFLPHVHVQPAPAIGFPETFAEVDRLSGGQAGALLLNCRAAERRSLIAILVLIVRIEQTRTHLQEGFSSVFAYCLQRLGYSESAAGRRIAAARAARKFPALLELLRTGQVSLCVAARAAGVLTPQNHAQILPQLRGKTVRQADEVLAQWLPRERPRDEIRPLGRGGPTTVLPPVPVPIPAPALTPTPSPTPAPAAAAAAVPAPPAGENRFRIAFDVCEGFLSMRDRVQALMMLRSQSRTPNLKEFFWAVMRTYVWVYDPRYRTARRQQKSRRRREKQAALERGAAGCVPKRPQGRPHVPAELRDAVWIRDEGRCTFVGADGRRCGSRWWLEMDHIVPVARGGPTTLENVRLLCGRHNRFEAERVLGRDAIQAAIAKAKRRGRRAREGLTPPGEAPP
jgi:5-methylcytosine-specific restriction endonuclease McrA